MRMTVIVVSVMIFIVMVRMIIMMLIMAAFVMAMTVMAVVIMMVVIVVCIVGKGELHGIAYHQRLRSFCRQKGHDNRLGRKGRNRSLKPRRQLGPDPEHHISPVQCLGL